MVTVGVGVLCLMPGLMIGYEVAYYRQVQRSMTTEQMLKSIDIEKLHFDEEQSDEYH